MPTLKSRLALAVAAIAALALPAAASAEYLVPPDNSAVNQYTESLPTPRGSRDSEQSAGRKSPSPSKALGERNARRLEQQGEDGRAVAAFAAATDPSAETAGESEGDDENAGTAATGRGDGGSGSAAGADAGQGAAQRTEVDEPSGSSALAEVVGEATGTSSAGQLGLWLPLILLATAAWAIAYALRQRKPAG